MWKFIRAFWRWLTWSSYIVEGKCALCPYQGYVLDLENGDYVCAKCWNNWTPTII